MESCRFGVKNMNQVLPPALPWASGSPCISSCAQREGQAACGLRFLLTENPGQTAAGGGWTWCVHPSTQETFLTVGMTAPHALTDHGRPSLLPSPLSASPTFWRPDPCQPPTCPSPGTSHLHGPGCLCSGYPVVSGHLTLCKKVELASKGSQKGGKV